MHIILHLSKNSILLYGDVLVKLVQNEPIKRQNILIGIDKYPAELTLPAGGINNVTRAKLAVEKLYYLSS